MRISLNWLRELVDIDLPPEELAEALTMAGFEVEDIEDRRTWAAGVVVGKVLKRDPHPNADKLSVCQVDAGMDAPLTIVCGAANVKADLYVPVATVGAYLAVVDLKIRPTKLRGVRSEGMICSLQELGLAKESEGIHSFAETDLTPGADVRPLLGLDDVVLDLTATANRADALSMVGVAREVAALTGAELALPVAPEITLPKTSSTPWLTSEKLTVKVAESRACPAYIGTAIENIQVKPSPEWLQYRLQASGIRPINNVVDITNYVLLEWGQPLHAFDRESLMQLAAITEESGQLALGVRFAEKGESLKTLDGQTRALSTQNLAIVVNDKPVALAGVMGGEETEVRAETKNLILEAALFDPAAIRRSARNQGLRSESSARYERGISQAALDLACCRAVDLLVELADGVPVAQARDDSRPDPSAWTRSIELHLERVNQVLGPVMPEEALDEGEELQYLPVGEVKQILEALGCQVASLVDGQSWTVAVPAYRSRDLEREIDLIEEIARLYGYNRFCDTLPERPQSGYLPAEQVLQRQLRAAFRAAGLTELVHYSLVKPVGGRQIAIANPLLAEYSALRTDLVSGLIDAFQYNLEQGNGPLNGYEIGHIFWQDEAGLQEKEVVAGIFGGDPARGRWVRGGREYPMTWYEAKGQLESVFQRFGLVVEYQPDRRNPRLHPGRTASLWLRGERLGTFGQLHPQLRQERDLPEAVYCFELDLALLLAELTMEELLTPEFASYSTYPASSRDIAFFISTDVSVAEIERTIHKVSQAATNKQTKENLLESVELFDRYAGEGIPEGQHSLAFRLVYRGRDRTLTDADVDPVHQQVREAIAEKFDASLRS